MTYNPLPLATPVARGVIPQRAAPADALREPEYPAIVAMTDFTRECPVMASPERRIDDALQDMIQAGVRSLLVVAEGRVLGLITANDIQGERPIRFLRSANCLQEACRHSDIQVKDIMTPLEELPALDVAVLQRARLGDLAETFRRVNQSHLLVVEPSANDGCRVRGLISCTRLERQLDRAVTAAPGFQGKRAKTGLG